MNLCMMHRKGLPLKANSILFVGKNWIMRTTQEIINLLKDFKVKQASKYGIRRMGVFGSVARGEQHEDSDVDVYIEGEVKGLFALAGVKNELEELLGCQVDIIRLSDRMDAFLKKRIQKEGIYV